MTNLKNLFHREPKHQKGILVSSAVALIATFLPWMSISFGKFGGFGGVSASGWNGFGWLTVLGASAILALWLLPKFGAKIELLLKTEEVQKISAVAILAGPVINLIRHGFGFSYLGIGFYLALAAGAGVVYFTFKK